MDLPTALRNWQRWCLDTSECKTPGYPGEWPMGKVALPYKVMVTEDEALEEMESTRKADEQWGMRFELWVQQLEPWLKYAFQTHYIYCPDGVKTEWKLTSEEIAMWRARRVARFTGQRVDVDEYHRMVGAAYAELREALRVFMRGV